MDPAKTSSRPRQIAVDAPFADAKPYRAKHCTKWHTPR